MLALEPYRSKAAGFPDLLNYAALIDEGIVLGKDGSLLAGFFFTPDDATSTSNEERNYRTEQLNKYLLSFDSSWAMWVDAARLPSPGYPAPEKSHFTDPISALIEAERRKMFERQDGLFETEYALFLQYNPPRQKEAQMMNMFMEGGSKANKNLGPQILADFKKRLTDFQDGVKDLLHMRRMGTIEAGSEDDLYESDQLINYLHFSITGESLALRTPDCPMYLDSWLGIPSLWPGNMPALDEKYIACVAIDGFPSKTSPGILTVLENLAVPYRWSTRFIFLEQHEALGALEKFRAKWEQTIKGWSSQIFKTAGVTNTDSVKMTMEATQAMADARSSIVTYGYYTPVVVLMSENKELLEEQARYVRKVINSRGFNARVETVNALEAWLGTLPGHPYPNVRRPLIHTLNLADLLPLSRIWPGLAENPCPMYPAGSPPLMHTVTTGATPFRLNLHVGDVAHTKIFGPTGAGKSTLLNTIVAQFRRYESRSSIDGSAPATVTAFDKGRSMYALCKATGGQHYDIGSDDVDDLSLCPLIDIDTASDSLWAEEWLGTCYKLQQQGLGDKGKPFTPHQKNEIHRAITLLRDAPRSGRSLTDFIATVQDADIRQALQHYTVTGSMGHLLDGHEDSLKKADFVVYEIDELMSLGDENAIPVLLYLFRRFEKSLTGQPALLVLDEAWVMLGNEVFRKNLHKWLVELRKQNCGVVLATQSLSAAVRSGLIDVLLEQCPTTILLPNCEAKSEGTDVHPGPAVFYRMFGLNDNEIDLLSRAQYKKEYYYRSPNGNRMFELGLGPLALSFVAISDKERLREVKACEAAHGEDWPFHWLTKEGVNYEQYFK